MTSVRTLIRKRTVSLGLLVVVAAGAMFASGVLVANATRDDGAATPATEPTNSSNSARSLVAPAPAIGSNATGLGEGKGGGTAPSAGLATESFYGPGGACGDSIAGAMTGSQLDPAKAGFTSNLLTNGFTLTGMSFGSSGNCGADGNVTDAHLTLGTQWRYGDSVTVMVTQRQGVNDNTPNLVQQQNVTFTAGGYTYNLWANSNVPIAVDAGTGAGPDKPLPMPIRPQNDAEATKALEAAIAQLAPGIGAQCYWRQTDGSWSDLAALGIGDPRPAVPSNFIQSGITLTRYTAPAAGCPASAVPYAGQANVYAAFADSNGSQINVNVNSNGGIPASGAGHLDDNNASWSNGSYYFSVFGNGNGLNRDVIRRIATALDPSFANACLVTTRKLSDIDVAKLGVHAPSVPSGYRLDQSSFTGIDGTSGCAAGTSGGYSLTWMMVDESKGGYIEAGVSHGTLDPSIGIGVIIDTSLLWKDEAGNTFHVSALKAEVSRDILLGVAKSMDPKFTESRLEKNPVGNGGIVPPSAGGGSVPPVPAAQPKRD